LAKQAKAGSIGVVLLREELPVMTEASLAGCGSDSEGLIPIMLQPAMVTIAASKLRTSSVRQKGVRYMCEPWGMCNQGSEPAQAVLALIEEVKTPELDC